MDIAAIFTILNRRRVKYILVGGLGAIAHGARLQTTDVDICIATDAPNLQRIAAALREMDAHLLRPPTGRPVASIDMDDWASLRLDDPSEHHLFNTPFGELDVLPAPFGPGGWNYTTTYEQLKRRAVTIEAFGLTIPVAAFDDIAASKLALGRVQDLSAQAELIRVQQLLAQGVDPGYGLEQFATQMAKTRSDNVALPAKEGRNDS